MQALGITGENMKRLIVFWLLIPLMAAAGALTGCSDDDEVQPWPETQKGTVA